MQHPRESRPQWPDMPRPHAASRPATETVAAPRWPPGPLARAALDAAARGWPVFPVRPRAKIPAVTDWENAATTDPDRITAWWSARAWNIGLCTGRAQLLVVDLDIGRGDQPPPDWAGARDGADVLDQLAAAAGQPPPTGTYTVLTPTGGRHLYFRQPAGTQLRNTQGALGWRIDTRGHGGFVLAAGSRSPHGHYRALPHPVAKLPDWITGALTSTLEPAVEAQSTDRPAVSGWRVQAYLRAVVEGERRNVVTATVGQRHRTLLRAARRLGHWVGGGVLAADSARAVLTTAAGGYIGVGGYTSEQVDHDITDGLAYGARRPRLVDNIPDRPIADGDGPGR